MKNIKIMDQPRLGFSRTFMMTITGIRYRLFRSIITLTVVSVAIAFMMNILSESIAKKNIMNATQNKIKENRMAITWAARLTLPETAEEILMETAKSETTDPFYSEVKTLAGLSENQMVLFYKNAQDAGKYLDYFSRIDYGQKRQLVHNANSIDIFDRLQNRREMYDFESALKSATFIHFITTADEFKSFLSRWQKTKKIVLRILETHTKAREDLALKFQNKTILEALEDANGGFGNVIRSVGFNLDSNSAKIIAMQAKDILDRTLLEEATVSKSEVRKAVAFRANKMPASVTVGTLWDLIKENKTNAMWYLFTLKENGVDPGNITEEKIISLADKIDEEVMLSKAERDVLDIGGGFMGIGKRMSWLVLISMIVCVVGITNVMLMSVTERFREIATLKCLGALDGYILLTFIYEALLLGIVGGILGTFLGSIIGLGRIWFAFGTQLFFSIHFLDIFLWMILSVIMGVFLSILASIYPSLKAARLAPMEAMRIE